MSRLTNLDWPARAVLAAIVAVAIGGGAFLIVRTSGDEGDPTTLGTTATAGSPTTPPAASATPPPPTETELSPTDPASTEPAPTDPPRPAPAEDTRVAIRDLPTLDQIQMAADGTYFIADRGDGCSWAEVFRGTITFQGEDILHITLDTDCRTDFNYAFWPDRDEVHIQVE